MNIGLASNNMALSLQIGRPAEDFGFGSVGLSCSGVAVSSGVGGILSSMRVAGRHTILTRRERVPHMKACCIDEFGSHDLSTSVVHRS
jgi:hypothetical protein